jgi:single-strand DNA-binding protein
LSVATKESWKDASGVWQSRTEWHRVVLFSRLAEYARTLAKGSRVAFLLAANETICPHVMPVR